MDELDLRVIRVSFWAAMDSQPERAAQHVAQARELLDKLMASATNPLHRAAIEALRREVDESV